MRIFTFFKYVSAVVGSALVIGAVYLFINKLSFTQTAIDARGTVVELLRIKFSKSSTYSPVVAFNTRKGKKIKFTANFSSHPPAYHVQENVAVLYDPINPKKAFINSFSSLYLGPLALGVIGTAFSLVGLLGLRTEKLKREKKIFLKQNGKTIMTKFMDVQIDSGVTLNDSHPYFICSEWLDPATNKIHLFESANIWFDPTDFVKSDEIKVIIDSKDPANYYMDISFLPVIEA